MNMDSIFDSLRRGTEQLSLQNATEKNAALKAVCRSLKANKEAIFKANEEDVKLARAKGTKESLR